MWVVIEFCGMNWSWDMASLGRHQGYLALRVGSPVLKEVVSGDRAIGELNASWSWFTKAHVIDHFQSFVENKKRFYKEYTEEEPHAPQPNKPG